MTHFGFADVIWLLRFIFEIFGGIICAILADFKIPKYVIINPIEFSSIILTTEFFG